jgi:excisionase family DNA binding protein
MQMQRQTQTRKLSVEEAADEMGVSPFTVRAWVREKRIPFYRLGRRILFDESDIAALLRNARVEPLAEMAR